MRFRRFIQSFFAAAAVLLVSAVLAGPAFAAADGFGALSSACFPNYGWQDYQQDGRIVMRAGTFPSALRFGLTGQPEGSTGTVQYQVCIGGAGWGETCENGMQAGNPEGDAPIEAVRLWFNGSLAENYDIYYRVFRNGSWSGWAKNGETAGNEGSGERLDGIRVTLTYKNAGAPEDALSRIDPSRPVIAVTFDDGPSQTNTPRVLSVLEATGARATFFVLGKKAAAGADILQRMAADGCEIGNHTWNHEYLHKTSADGIISTLNRTNDAIQAACGIRPVIMRPPGGGYNDRMLATVGSLGMSAYYWSIDTRDWEHRNAAKTIDAVLSKVRDGDIILMHDIHDATADAVQTLIPELVNRGYQLVTISELAELRGGAQPGQIYFSFR